MSEEKKLMKKITVLIGVFLFLVGCFAGQQAQYQEKPSSERTSKIDIGSARDIYDGALFPDKAVRTFSNTDKLFPTRTIKAGNKPYPLPMSDNPLPIKGLSISSGEKKYDLFDYMTLNRVVGLLILKDGKIVFEHYDFGFTPSDRWMSMSVAKSFTSTLVGAAINDGFIGSINDPVTNYILQLKGSAYDNVSLRNLVMMSSGVKWDETYTDPASDRRKYLEFQIASNKPGAVFDLLRSQPKASEPGTVFNYNTGETSLIGEIVRAATKKNLADYLSEKIWMPLSMESDALWWLDAPTPNGHEVAGSGVLATLRDFARFGQFILNGAQIGGKKIVPDWWLAEATKLQVRLTGDWSYGYQWWPVNAQVGGVHEGAFMGRGSVGQYLYINPKEKIVGVGLGARPKMTGKDVIKDLDFMAAVMQKLRNQ